MNIGYEKMYRDAVKRAEKAEAELAILNAKGTPNQKAVQRFAIEQQIKGATEAVNHCRNAANWCDTTHYRTKQAFDAIDLHIKQLRKELEK